jgi:hypothetical protein
MLLFGLLATITMRLYQSVLCSVFSIFLLSSQVNAAVCLEKDVRNLFVNIQNLGSENCQLVESNIHQGHLIFNNLPQTLDATGEGFQFIVQGNTVELRMKYNCGTYKTFTLYMKKFLKKGYHHTSMKASMSDAVDVFETHKIEKGVHICDSDGYGGVSCYSKAAKINWSITH